MISGYTVLYAILLISGLVNCMITGRTIAYALMLNKEERGIYAPFTPKMWGLYAFTLFLIALNGGIAYQLVK